MVRTQTLIKLTIALVTLPVAVVLGLALVVMTILSGQSCTTQPSEQAKQQIPRNYLDLYQQAGHRYDIDPAFLASIGAQETNHGRAQGSETVNPSGCVGPMQIGIAGQCGDEWSRYAEAGPTGVKDPRDAGSAIFTAARILKEDKHVPPIGGSAADYRRAACGYYGACGDRYAGGYASQVMSRAEAYGFRSGNVSEAGATAGEGCSGGPDVNSGVLGRVNVAPGANRPGAPLNSSILSVVARTAGIVGHPLTVSTGTNHSEATVDGQQSDHWTGDAVDIDVPLDSPEGDQIAAAGLQTAGLNPVDAQDKARHGGLYTVWRGNERIQVIWKTDAGGNHHNHVHLGDKVNPGPVAPSSVERPGKDNIGVPGGNPPPVPNSVPLQPAPSRQMPGPPQKLLPDPAHTGLSNR